MFEADFRGVLRATAFLLKALRRHANLLQELDERPDGSRVPGTSGIVSPSAMEKPRDQVIVQAADVEPPALEPPAQVGHDSDLASCGLSCVLTLEQARSQAIDVMAQRTDQIPRGNAGTDSKGLSHVGSRIPPRYLIGQIGRAHV